MEPMKISFGFSKLTKKSNVISTKNAEDDEKKVEIIECLEGQSIKIKGAVEEVKQPLIIPLKENENSLIARIKAARNQTKLLNFKKEEPEDDRPDEELNEKELAARHLLREAKARENDSPAANGTQKVSILPVNENPQPLQGEKEPTLDDYESVPISDYGLALLRGMGWKEGTAIGKNVSKSAIVNLPELRPKGLGLGASKLVQSELPAKKAVDKNGEELVLIKGCCAKIIAGPEKGNYCKVEGFDEEAGRVIIRVYPVKKVVNINELMLVPVTNEEFAKGSKILNNLKYEKYKEISDNKLENTKKREMESIKSEIVSSDSERESSKHTKNSSSRRSRSRSYERRRSSKHRTRHESKSSCSEDESVSRNDDKISESKTSRKHSSQHSKKHKSKSRDTHKDKYDSDSDSKTRKNRKKKSKCKSRHRRGSESSTEDRRHKTKR